MIGLPDSFLKSYNEKHSPHTLFGIISSAVSQGADWATALVNWAGRKEITINGAANTATTTDDFTGTDDWVDSDSTKMGVNVTSDVLEITMDRDGSNDKTVLDLTSVSDLSWVIRYNQVNFSQLGAVNAFGFSGISSGSQTVDNNTAQDFVGIVWNTNGESNRYSVISADGVVLPAHDASSEYTFVATVGVDYWVELKRINGTKVQLTWYYDSEFTEVAFTTSDTMSADVTGLRYLCFQNYHGATGDTPIIFTVNKVQFYNGISVVSNIPAQQTVTFEDDFDTDDWDDVGSNVQVGSGVIDFNVTVNNVNHSTSYDIGTANISETAWILRWKQTYTTVTVGSDNSSLCVGLSSNLAEARTAQNFIGLFAIVDSSNADLQIRQSSGSGAPYTTGGTNFTNDQVTGTLHYYELIRESATQARLNIYSDSDYTVLIESQIDVISTAHSSLRYLRVFNESEGNGTSTCVCTGTIDDFEFYNGITELNPATLTDYPLTIKIQGDADLMEKTTETLDEKFTSTGSWAVTGTTVIVEPTTNQRLNWDGDRVDDATSLDVTGASISETAWTLDFDFHIESNTLAAGANEAGICVGMTDLNHGSRGSTAQDGIVFFLDNWGSATYHWGIAEAEAETLGDRGGGGAARHTDFPSIGATNQGSKIDYFIRLQRLSATAATCIVYADSAHTIQLDKINIAVTSLNNALRYLKIFQYGTDTSPHTIEGWVDNVKFWDGITNPVTQETATLSDDFSTYEQSITATVDDDFTSYGSQETADAVWVPKTTATDVNITNDNLDFNVVGTDTASLGFYYDLGLISEDAWLLRFKLNFSTYTDGDYGQLPFAISDNATSGIGASQANVGMVVNRGGGVLLNVTDNSTHMVGNTGSAGSDFSASTDYYCQMSRNNLNFNLKIFSDSAYSVLIQEIDRNITSNIPVSLRYFKIANDTASGAGETTGTLDDFQFWNGVSQTVSPVLKTASALLGDSGTDLIDDFTSSGATSHTSNGVDVGGWITNDFNYCLVNGSTDKLDLNSSAATENDAISFDLGSSLSETAWTIDFDYTTTAVDQGSDSSEIAVMFGISSLPYTSNVLANQDSVTIVTVMGSSRILHVFSSGEAGNMLTMDNVLTAVPTDSTTLYCRMIRKSATLVTLELYTNADRATLLETSSITVTSALNGLRYLKGGTWNENGTYNGTGIDSTIDNIVVWDGQFAPVVDNAWVTADSTKASVNLTNENIDFDFKVLTTKAGISRAISPISDSDWVMRWKHNYTTSSATSAYNYWVLSDSNTVDVSVAKDSLGVVISDDAIWLHVKNNATSISSAGTGGSTTQATGVDYYFEVKRWDTTNAKVTVRTGSHEGAVHTTFTVTDVPATLNGLTHFVGYNRNNENGSGHIIGTLDDFQFWNGISSPNAEGRKIVFTDNVFDEDAIEYASETISYDPINGDLEAVVKIPSLATGADTTIQMYYDYTPDATPSYVPELLPVVDLTGTTADSVWGTSASTAIEDFTTYTDQTDADNSWASSDTAKMRVNVSTDLLETTCVRDSSSDNITYDLGLLSDTAWTIKYSYKTTVNSGDPLAFFGLSSINSGDISNSNQDSLYLFQRPAAGTTTQRFALSSTVNVIPASKVGSNQDAGTTLIPTTNTTYWIVFSRTSTTSYSVHVYSDSAETTLITSLSGTCSADVGSLRYFVVMGYSQDSASADLSSEIDDMEIWDGSAYEVPGNREQLTYNANYKAVYNLQGNSLDSTSNGNDGVVTDASPRQEGTDVGYDATGGDITLGSAGDYNYLHNGSDWTIEVKAKWDVLGAESFLFTTGTGASASASIWCYKNASNEILFAMTRNVSGSYVITNASTGITITDTNEHTFSFRYHYAVSAPVLEVFLDGVLVGNMSSTANAVSAVNSGTGFKILGNVTGIAPDMNGWVGYVRLLDKRKGQADIITTYNAEKSDSDIITAGDENTQ